ncbi:hypothetical protein [Loktanella sp. M215]|uniref:hypothetical protein n=1 Tax=Loktanella sp. M215 TaxID=2675431 RepID=UPI001F2AFB75|nr:hypothetical protein [Loktanella sp. M215]MCF7700715.1 hypothetical protein [Loktanella sp. M215]
MVVKNSATSSALPGSVGAVDQRCVAPSQASRLRLARFDTINIEFEDERAVIWRSILLVAPRRCPVLAQGTGQRRGALLLRHFQKWQWGVERGHPFPPPETLSNFFLPSVLALRGTIRDSDYRDGSNNGLVMITTGINIPAAVQKKLASAVAAIRRDAEHFTIADFRKRARGWEGQDGSHPAFFRMNLSQKGAVKAFEAHLLPKVGDKFTRYGFEAQVALFGRTSTAVRNVMPILAEYKVYREIERRKSLGLRELIKWSENELQDAAHMGNRTATETLRYSHDCGTVSEVFRARLAEHEIACREKESHHEHLDARSRNTEFLKQCECWMAKEREAANEWAEVRKAAGWGFYTQYIFESRSEEDRIMIAYRDRIGW